MVRDQKDQIIGGYRPVATPRGMEIWHGKKLVIVLTGDCDGRDAETWIKGLIKGREDVAQLREALALMIGTCAPSKDDAAGQEVMRRAQAALAATEH
jgi:hypothetical protein